MEFGNARLVIEESGWFGFHFLGFWLKNIVIEFQIEFYSKIYLLVTFTSC